MKSPRSSATCDPCRVRSEVPAGMGLSRLTIAVKRSSSMILAVPLARQGADEDQGDAGHHTNTRNARRHLPGNWVPTPRLPDGGLRENRATEPPIRSGLSQIRRGSVWPTI